MIGYFVLAGAIMTKLREPFAWFASTQAKLEGKIPLSLSLSLPLSLWLLLWIEDNAKY